MAAMEPNLAEEHDVREPLLSSEHKHSGNQKDESSLQISLPEHSGVTFKTGPRPYRDSVFTFLFLATLFLTYGFGIFAFSRADFGLDSKLRQSKFNPVTNQCEVFEKGIYAEGFHADSMWLKLMIVLPICALLVSFPIGMLLFWLLRRYTRGVVLVTKTLMIPVPVGLCAFWFIWCYGIEDLCPKAVPEEFQLFYAVLFPTVAAMWIYRIWRNWSGNASEASIQLLKMATDALRQHLSLLVLQPALFLGTLVLVNGPIFTFIWYAFNNGKIVPEFDVVHGQAPVYPRCVERHPEWFTAYITLAYFTAFWVLMITCHLQIMIVSGTISQWYFAPAGFSTSGNIKRSLRIAYGPSFGTACNLGTIVTTLVVAFLGLLKRVTTRVASSTSRQGLMSVMTRGCLSWMFQFPECQSRFAPNFAAISGTSFWESSKTASSLLRRNSLSTHGREFTGPTWRMIMDMATVYSLLQSVAVYAGLEFFLSADNTWNFLIAEFCYVATLLGLTLVWGAISSVIDTVYVCYAMEKDTGDISKPELCDAYMVLSQKEALQCLPADQHLN